MRLVASFWIMAVFFGLTTEAMDVWFDDKDFSILAATIRGLIFSTLMTGFFYWKGKDKKESS